MDEKKVIARRLASLIVKLNMGIAGIPDKLTMLKVKDELYRWISNSSNDETSIRRIIGMILNEPQ